MSEKEKTAKETSKRKDDFQAEFEALPLDEKFSRLFKMEAVTIGETINYVVNNSGKVIDKAVEAINDLGRKAQAECSEKNASDENPKAERSKKEDKKADSEKN
ncbi:MAG: hypothetical protein KF756_13415 [Acidobacteria bacterium]|nr:hypothetical protein [Acidobacteriota bacterium]